MKRNRYYEHKSFDWPPRAPRTVGGTTRQHCKRLPSWVACGGIVLLFTGLDMPAVHAQTPPPYGTASWAVTATGSQTVQFQGSETQNPTVSTVNSSFLNAFSLYLPSPHYPAAPSGVSIAIASANWAINCIYNGSNGLPDPVDAPPVLVEMYSEAEANWTALGTASGANEADDALGGVSTAEPTAYVNDDKYLVFQPSNGQLSLGTFNLRAGCSVTGAQTLGVGGELLGIIFNYPEVVSPTVSQYYSKGPGGVPVPDAYQPDGSITVDLPLTVAQSSGTGPGSMDAMDGHFSLFYNDNTDSVNKPTYTIWTAEDHGSTTTSLEPLLASIPYQPVSGGTTYSMKQVIVADDVTVPYTAPDKVPSMTSLGSTTIKADLHAGVNPAGDPIPDLSNVMNINWHYQLENPVSVGTPIDNWVYDPSFHMVPPLPPATGYDDNSTIPYTKNTSAGSDAGTAVLTAAQTYAPGVFSILSALANEYPQVSGLFAGVEGVASLFPPGGTVQEYLDWDGLWTKSSMSTPMYYINGQLTPNLPAGDLEKNFILTSLTSQIRLKNNFYTMDKYGANGYQGQFPIDIRYQVGRKYFPVFTYSP